MSWFVFVLLCFGLPGFLVAGFLSGDWWLGFEPGILLVFFGFGFVVGSLVGMRRRRVWAGAWLGLLLGVFGWVLAAKLPPRRPD